MTNGINELLDAAGQAVKVFPKLYEDGLQPAVQETSKIIARIPRAINAAFSSFDIWIDNKTYNVDATKVLLAKKLENVDPDKIVTPEAYVAVPALQTIAYSMDSEELRNLYANLLAKSMQIDKKDSVHPSFVEIIKQLSPFDANTLKLLFKNVIEPDPMLPIVRIFATNIDKKDGIVVRQHILESNFSITKENVSFFELSIDNLIRLNLISVEYNEKVSKEDVYEEILETKIVQNLIHEISTSEIYPNHNNPYVQRGILHITPFGLSFIKTCID